MRTNCSFCHDTFSEATPADTQQALERHIVKDHPELRIVFSAGGQL